MVKRDQSEKYNNNQFVFDFKSSLIVKEIIELKAQIKILIEYFLVQFIEPIFLIIFR